MVVESLRLMRQRLAADKQHRLPGKENLPDGQAKAYSYQRPVPLDMWVKCSSCSFVIFNEEFTRAGQVCPSCGHHYRIDSRTRLLLTCDAGSFSEWDAGMASQNPLEFAGYTDKVRQLQEKTGLVEAVITGRASIGGQACAVGIMDSRFMMGSMGSVVGEKICRLFERSCEERLPVVLFTASGGARMQEGIISLMQMAKTSAAVGRFKASGLLYISVLTDPTTGGVTASFASQADIIISEPGTLIGFAGRRVIEGTIAQELPEGFQRAEFLLEHGFLDMIVPRARLAASLALLLELHEKKNAPASRPAPAQPAAASQTARSGSACLDLVRHPGRPVITDYLPLLFTDFIELHGDRGFGDDAAIWCGLGRFNGQPVTIIGHRKGRTILENAQSNFGMPHPEGYRKALRLMRQAEKFARPVICLIDTSGAYCGIGAEERGQGEAIAQNILEMFELKTPLIGLVTGEGGSGGALAIGVCDRLGMLSNAVYSVISPRGFASLLWKDPGREKEAADILKITAPELKKLGICDSIIAEPLAGAHTDPAATAAAIRYFLHTSLAELEGLGKESLLASRYDRYRQIGMFSE